jgi:hypothetical protein
MSAQEDKEKRSKRLLKDQNAINKQVRIAKDYHMHKNGKWKYIEQPHRNHKTHILNCGDPKCTMCMNPRKAFGEKTMQELKFEQDVETIRDKRSNGTPMENL